VVPPLIEKGFAYLEAAAEPFEVSSYHLEAAIASLHAAAPSFAQTDWPGIYHLYKALYAIHPGPVVAFNKAIASAYAVSREAALPQLLAIKGWKKIIFTIPPLAKCILNLLKKTRQKNGTSRRSG
jgi:RNA polymerase sigma-70 factor (ECF subfamily)